MVLTRDQFEKRGPTVEEVRLLGSEDTVCIRMMSPRVRANFDSKVIGNKDLEYPPAWLVCLCLCDSDGNLFFPEAWEDADAWREAAEALEGKDYEAPVIEDLFFKCRDLNKMGPDAVEAAAKNSEPIRDDSSNTD